MVGRSLALAATGLIGEVFYTGAVAISLTHPRDGQPPSLREIAGMVNYGRLIAVDLIYGPWSRSAWSPSSCRACSPSSGSGLPRRWSRSSTAASAPPSAAASSSSAARLLVVAFVLIPIELVGDALTDLVTGLAHDAFGGSLLAEWVADVLTNIAFTPFYAVAAVLLTLDLIREKGGGVELHSGPPVG